MCADWEEAHSAFGWGQEPQTSVWSRSSTVTERMFVVKGSSDETVQWVSRSITSSGLTSVLSRNSASRA